MTTLQILRRNKALDWNSIALFEIPKIKLFRVRKKNVLTMVCFSISTSLHLCCIRIDRIFLCLNKSKVAAIAIK